MVKAYTLGPIKENMKVNGSATRCMAKVLLHGLMVENISVSTPKIRKEAMASSHGLMEGVIGENGSMGSNMEKELL